MTHQGLEPWSLFALVFQPVSAVARLLSSFPFLLSSPFSFAFFPASSSCLSLW